MRAPDFWQRRAGLAARLLGPVGTALAAAGSLRRGCITPEKMDVPVICVGNLVAGGAGKTPVALSLAAHLRATGRTPHFLSRGYGGRLRGPLRVNPARHSAVDVGDEPLLLAAEAPCWIGANRRASARQAIAAGAHMLILDDGFQNPSLAKDLSLLVFDGGYGVGNGRLIPAGPLREPLAAGLARADGVIVIGRDDAGLARLLEGGPPIYEARLAPGPEADTLAGKRVVAFAGIGRPAKFFATLADIGCELVGLHGFADHHFFTPDEIMRLCDSAQALGAVPVTTMKDFIRLPVAAQALVKVLTVTLEWREADSPDRLLAPLLADA